MKNQKYATASLQVLVEQVFNSIATPVPITYSELAKKIGRLNKQGDGHGHGMGSVLADMGHLLQKLEGEWGEPVPYIQSLVVNKTGNYKDLPADGIKEFWEDYPNLTRQEKINKIRIEYENIKKFGSRWNQVLSALHLPTIKIESKGKRSSKRVHYGSGGESLQHKDLKEYVNNHRQKVGADKNDKPCFEYTLPSGDVVDVLFKGLEQWVAVEVKSSISDNIEKDYERGIYQCVKYRSILEAMKYDKNYEVPKRICVVLALESRLPKELRSLAKTLNIIACERIRDEPK